MRIAVPIVGISAALALGAPVAAGTPNVTIGHRPAGHKAGQGSSTKPAGANGAEPGVHRAPFPAWPVSTPRYIYIPAYSGTVDTTNEPDCATSGDNCTPQQLCDMWGVNCPAPAP